MEFGRLVNGRENINHRKLEVSEKAPKTWEKTGPGEFVLPFWKLGVIVYSNTVWHCSWLKSCTSWFYPIIYKVLYILGRAGFLSSTVGYDYDDFMTFFVQRLKPSFRMQCSSWWKSDFSIQCHYIHIACSGQGDCNRNTETPGMCRS